ncbi:hypothetical protein [Rhodohalobacter halophilus]|uniref:hypothetical protein n=1 Tax=Rhodohalobacter halophilus TaxID=1812810 RepID=UPI00083F8AAD|nr:hypothetical protein [Rhodohalobacter halophilus]
MNSSKHKKRIPAGSKEANDISNNFKSDSSGKLLVFAGKNRSDKKRYVDKLSKSVKKIDLRDIVSTVEEETYENIEALFNSFDGDNLIYLENGDVLNGEYTGNTYSFRRYATPQEKFLLKKIEESKGKFILDLLDEANVTNRLERISDAVITFHAPEGGLGRLFWNLKNVSVHGHTFENKRPLKK